MAPSSISRIRGRVVQRMASWYRRNGIRRTDVSTESILHAARSTIDRSRYCVLVTSAGDVPAARVVQPRRPDDEFIIHIGTSPTSNKAGDIRRTGRAALVYTDYRRGAGVTVRCAAELLGDPATRRRHFLPVWRAFWPAGPDDPGFVVLRCIPTAIEVWDRSRGITPAPFGLAAARIDRVGGTWTLAA